MRRNTNTIHSSTHFRRMSASGSGHTGCPQTPEGPTRSRTMGRRATACLCSNGEVGDVAGVACPALERSYSRNHSVQFGVIPVASSPAGVIPVASWYAWMDTLSSLTLHPVLLLSAAGSLLRRLPSCTCVVGRQSSLATRPHRLPAVGE